MAADLGEAIWNIRTSQLTSLMKRPGYSTRRGVSSFSVNFSWPKSCMWSIASGRLGPPQQLAQLTSYTEVASSELIKFGGDQMFNKLVYKEAFD